MRASRHLLFVTAAAIMTLATLPRGVQAQAGPADATISAQVTAHDRAAALQVTNHFCHVHPVRPGHGVRNPMLPDCQRHTSLLGAGRSGTAGVGSPSAGSVSPPFFYLTDVFNNGGPVVQSAQFYSLFLNCTPLSSCWGNPIQFQTDLFASTFIHLVDQYVGVSTNGRYQVGGSINLTASEPNIMQLADVQAAVIAGVRRLFPGGGGGGYTNAYNFFLPPGQDTCLQPGICYSPDTPSTFVFCAYHSSMNTTDANGAPIHVLYTVLPYQNVRGCQATNAPFPNGQLADSTNNALSHEIFELLTDPDGNAWWQSQHGAGSGAEIGDLCFAEPQNFPLNGNPYDVQLEYTNQAHGCGSSP